MFHVIIQNAVEKEVSTDGQIDGLFQSIQEVSTARTSFIRGKKV